MHFKVVEDQEETLVCVTYPFKSIFVVIPLQKSARCSPQPILLFSSVE